MLDDFPAFAENVLLGHSESLYSFKLFVPKEHKQRTKKCYYFINMHVRIFSFSLLISEIFLCHS